MARLLLKLEGAPARPIELKMGLNRFGRSEENDFPIDHPTVSAAHCEIYVGASVVLHDIGSSNGTFLNGRQVEETTLHAGQTVHLGEVELFVETTDVIIAIPQFEVPQTTSSVRLADGSLSCHHHPNKRAIGQCQQCKKVFCARCLHDLHRVGGKHHRLCPVCSGECVPLDQAKPKQKSLFARLRETLKMPVKR